jgi:hypothetical protein
MIGQPPVMPIYCSLSFGFWASTNCMITGPMQTNSIGGSFYFLTFIDDFSRKIWIYFLRHKSKTFTKFKEFKSEDEKYSAKYVKFLRSDGGGEYCSK